VPKAEAFSYVLTLFVRTPKRSPFFALVGIN
jgi:hypothetical protein